MEAKTIEILSNEVLEHYAKQGFVLTNLAIIIEVQ